MKKVRKFLELLSPEITFYIAAFIVTFSLLLTGIHNFCQNVQVSAATEHVEENPEQIQENLAKNIIRLHVIANSDTDADQKLKLKVRDAIITSLQEALSHTDSIDDAKQIIHASQTQIRNTAQKVIAEQNSAYEIKVTLCPRYFPIKQYGDLCFPAGVYNALCVEIGKAEGRNWWCVLFPSLCFVNETTATVPEESKEKLKERLSEEEYQSLSEGEMQEKNENDKPELRLGILDWFKELLQ